MTRLDILKQNFIYQIDLMKTPGIQQLAREVMVKIPESFWTRPSSKNYHHEDERGECGNLLHTLRVTKITRAVYSMTNMPKVKVDQGIFASLFHDSMKFDLDGLATKILTNEHASLMANWLRKNYPDNPYVPEIADIIENHMGKWCTPYYQLSINQKDIICIADCLEVQDYIKVDI